MNKDNALQLSKLILDNPNLRVVSWIKTIKQKIDIDGE